MSIYIYNIKIYRQSSKKCGKNGVSSHLLISLDNSVKVCLPRNQKEKNMLDVNKLFTEVKDITFNKKRGMMGTSVDEDLKEKLKKFCYEKKITLSQGLDLCIYITLVRADVDFSEFKKQINAPTVYCTGPSCYTRFKQNQNCPVCGKPGIECPHLDAPTAGQPTDVEDAIERLQREALQAAEER